MDIRITSAQEPPPTPAIGVGIAELVRVQIETMAAAWQRRRVQAFTRTVVPKPE